MDHNLLISTTELFNHLEDPNWLVVDCRFALINPEEKEALYLKAHIPGAIYAHLNRDLSGEVIPGKTGRHPLPAADQAARRLGDLGIGPETQVVAYDDQGGSLAAVRLWFLLQWIGHERAAVLDGGWQKWLEEEYPTRSGRESRLPQELGGQLRQGLFADLEEIERLRLDPDFRLIDVRLPERYRGDVEPIDPVAGHIPGAINFPYTMNLSEEGTFLTPEAIRERYSALLKGVPPEKIVFYCGSGVTSIHSVLALHYAGLGQARFYPGSWSEWIAGGMHPVALGPEPDTG